MSVRYFLYLNLMSMLVNAIINVPSILYKDRFHGAIMSMLLALPISTALTILFSKSLIKFPNKSLPDIFKLSLPKWLRYPIILYLGGMWYIGGFMVLVVFAVLSVRYINPDVSFMYILILFMLTAAFGALQASKTILYIVEIIIILNVPFIGFIIAKAFSSQYMDWKEVMQMGSYVWMWPTWRSLAASSYLFIGYINMAVFNKVFEGKFTLKWYWIVPIVGFFNFISTFAVPIGFNSPEAVDNFVYPWVETADSMKMEYGFIERVVFVFLLLYISVSLMFGLVCWHVALNLIKSVFDEKKEKKWYRWLPYGILGLFLIPPLFLVGRLDQPTIMYYSQMWISHRLLSEILLVVGVFILTRRMGRHEQKN